MRHVSSIEAVSEEVAVGWDSLEGSTSSNSISMPQPFQGETWTFATVCASVHGGLGGTHQFGLFALNGHDGPTFAVPLAHSGYTSPYTIASPSMPIAETVYSKDVAT